MKRAWCALALAFALIAVPAVAGEKSTTLKISGWQTNDCVDYTLTQIKKTKGVKAASGELGKKQVLVKYDDKETDLTKIEEAVSNSGFKVDKS